MVRSRHLAMPPVLVALLVLTGGCSGGDSSAGQPRASATSASVAPAGPPASAVPGASAATSAPAGSAPADGVGDCGSIQLDQGEQLDEGAATCLMEAAAKKRPARLIVIQSTTEGDSITITYLADADGAIEVSTDSAPDASGNTDIELKRCTGPRLRDGELSFARCEAEDPIG